MGTFSCQGGLNVYYNLIYMAVLVSAFCWNTSENFENWIELVVVIDDFFIWSDHEAVVKAADHFTENTKKEALVLHLYEIDSLGLINRPREHIYQN